MKNSIWRWIAAAAASRFRTAYDSSQMENSICVSSRGTHQVFLATVEQMLLQP